VEKDVLLTTVQEVHTIWSNFSISPNTETAPW